MKYILFTFILILLSSGCAKKPQIMFDSLARTHLQKSSFSQLPDWNKENHDEVLENFINSCKSSKTKKIYQDLCEEAKNTEDSKNFIEKEFSPYKIYTQDHEQEGLLTGYYEPQLKGSLRKTSKYKYPIYTTPKDLIVVDLSSIYPDLKNYRLRGKLQGNKLVPYEKRKESSLEASTSDVICYTDSKIDLFFLEVQGSGRVLLENGETLFISYDNQNGHKYSSIGKYLVSIGALELEDVSLQTIRAWLDENPHRIDEVLNYNDSVVYFKESDQAATGSLGVCLTQERSVAVDRRYIPLGSMLYLNTKIQDKDVSKIVLAQDTGGAIKGPVRADMFLGYGEEAMQIAGELKSELELWIVLPKNKKVDKK